MIIIGIDFSIAKPAACVYDGNNYKFYSWVKNLSDRLIDVYIDADIKISKREHLDIKDLVCSDMTNANILADLIIDDLKKYINEKTIIVFEGASFASKGNQLISLTAWRYILMQRLYNNGIEFDHMVTYAPITLKKTAGASKKGMGKKEMIDSFLDMSICSFADYIKKDNELFKKKTGVWIDHLDDLIDSFFCVYTYLDKNHLISP